MGLGSGREPTACLVHWRKRCHQLSMCRLAVHRGFDLYALNRGATQLRPLPAEVKILQGDIRNQASVRQALGDHEFDVVVNWIAFTPDHIASGHRTPTTAP